MMRYAPHSSSGAYSAGMTVKREASSGIDDLPRAKRRKLMKVEAKHTEGGISCSSDPTVARLYAKDLRRSQRITPAELIRREKALVSKEQDCKRKSDELNERILLLSKREDEATMLLSQIAEREAQAVLHQVEDQFTCPL